jgi:flagellar hook-associated protein 3 FlgL
MRIADKMNYDQVNASLAKNRTDMAELQNQAATQKRVTKPSDDPLAAARILSTRTEIASGQQFIKSLHMARTFLEYSDQSLSELSELLSRAKELAISQSNDASANSNSRRVTATEVEQLYNQAVQVGNRKLGDRFLFGGFKTTRPPFDVDGNYKGDNGEIKIAVQKEGAVAMNIPGSVVFLGLNPTEVESGSEPVKVRDSNRSKESKDPGSVNLRGPASEKTDSEIPSNLQSTWQNSGVDVFKVLRELSIGLRADDKATIQESLDSLDEAIAQVVLSRSQLGSRVTTLNGALESLQKTQVDAKGLISNLEDVDTFELVSDINKTESTLKAALATSGKLIQPSLLDFLR